MLTGLILCWEPQWQWVHVCSTLVMSTQHCLLPVPRPLALTAPLCHFHSDPELQGWRCDIDVSCVAKHCSLLSPHSDQSWVLLLSIVYCTEKVLWWGLRAGLAYRQGVLPRRPLYAMSSLSLSKCIHSGLLFVAETQKMCMLVNYIFLLFA